MTTEGAPAPFFALDKTKKCGYNTNSTKLMKRDDMEYVISFMLGGIFGAIMIIVLIAYKR